MCMPPRSPTPFFRLQAQLSVTGINLGYRAALPAGTLDSFTDTGISRGTGPVKERELTVSLSSIKAAGGFCFFGVFFLTLLICFFFSFIFSAGRRKTIRRPIFRLTNRLRRGQPRKCLRPARKAQPITRICAGGFLRGVLFLCLSIILQLHGSAQ